MSSDDNNPLRDLTDCSICYSTLLEPKILPCGHTYCLTCVTRIYEANSEVYFDCPECRAVHSIHPQQIPTDFKLKKVVEMMHRMGQEKSVNNQRNFKICSSCASVGDIQNYFICETCIEDDLMRVYCSRCIVKQHQSHKVKDALEEVKINIALAMDKNMALIEHITHDTEFFRARYEAQSTQIAFVFQLFSTLCQRTKDSINKDFKCEHAKLAEVLNGFLDKAREDINRVLNQADNALYQLCMVILSSFQGAFNVPSNAMDHLKVKIMDKEAIDVFEFLSNVSKDELPNIDQGSSSAVTPNNDAFSPDVYSDSPRHDGPSCNLGSAYGNLLSGSNVQSSPGSRVGYGKAVLNRNKKKR